MKRFFSVLLRSFFQGLVILGPIGVTLYAIFIVFSKLDGLFPFVSKFGTGLGALSAIVVITLVGYLGTRFLLGRLLVQLFDFILEHTPGVKFLYTSVKDILSSFVGDKKKFNQPVWVKVNSEPAMYRIGFLTQEELKDMPEQDVVAVYLPHAYAISGWVIAVPKSSIHPITDMSAAEAMKFAVSGGVTIK